MKKLKTFIIEKLKVNPNIMYDGNTVDVPFYVFVIWYTGFINKTPDEIELDDFRTSDFVEGVTDSRGNQFFSSYKEAYDFYITNKDKIIEVTIEKTNISKQHRQIEFLNTIYFGKDLDIVFYADSWQDFREYLKQLYK